MKKNKTPPLISFKGSTVPAIVVTLRTLDPERLTAAASEMFGDSDFFDQDAGLLDLSHLAPEDTPAAPDWQAICACFAGHGLKVFGIRGAQESLMASAQAAGLALFPADERSHRQETQEPAEAEAAAPEPLPESPAAPSPEPVQEAAPETPPEPIRSTMVVDRPLRSGQQVYARGCDLVVLAIVNPGAEVIADGSIHIYAPLRGRALAGAQGDAKARIFTTRFEAELVSVAGVYRTFEGGVPADLAGHPVQVQADAEGNKLLLAPLKLD